LQKILFASLKKTGYHCKTGAGKTLAYISNCLVGILAKTFGFGFYIHKQCTNQSV